jgi:hypothetical protein
MSAAISPRERERQRDRETERERQRERVRERDKVRERERQRDREKRGYHSCQEDEASQPESPVTLSECASE